MKTGGMTGGLNWDDGCYENTARELLPATAAALDAAAIQPGEAVLDVGTGTGNAALAAARRGARVLGVDPALRLLEVARGRAAELGVALDFRAGTATALPVADATQDVALAVFSVIFEPDGPAAVAELVRVTRPGGRIVLTAWTSDGAIFRTGGHLRRAVSAGAPPPAGPAPTNWSDPDVIDALFAVHSLGPTRATHPLTFRAASPQAWLDTAELEHPAWRAGRRALDDAAWSALREVSLAELTAANEDPAAFAVTSTFRVVHVEVR
ncbi:MAG TPA: methyltransferase domain-containing protein [Sporichthyaceae bacterium]|nr:methyltransferase domain-containing protein [Sporichthyaceae bacterium]